MYRIRNGKKTLAEQSQNENAELVREPLLQCTCLAVDRSQLKSNGHQRIHTESLQDAKRMRTGQTARDPDKPHTNA